MAEAEWMTDEIRDRLKEKKRRNRIRRYSVGRDRVRNWVLWKKQKMWVQELVKREKGAWEEKLTKIARDSRDRGKTVWKVIRRLQGKGDRVEGKVYRDGKELDEEGAWGEIVEKWRGVCQMRVDNVMGVGDGVEGEI